jgi:hypothetical protein
LQRIEVEKLTCASCGGPLEQHSGPGRPSAYCGQTCRRLSEFRIRALTRRIDKAEVEIRELAERARDREAWDRDQWLRRLRALRRWLADDISALRALLGAPGKERT